MANTKKTTENVIELKPIAVKTARIYIEGDGDLVVNKMNARCYRFLSGDRNETKETPNRWEDIITAIHWFDGVPVKDTYRECTEELLHDMLKNNKPCITAFGLKKSFNQAVVRNEIDKYSTKFDNALNVVADKGLIPVEFAEWSLDERLMSPKRGAPVTTLLNHFSGWKANFMITYTDNVYTLKSILNIINLAGFGCGIGSGRSSGYGRYHIVSVES